MIVFRKILISSAWLAAGAVSGESNRHSNRLLQGPPGGGGGGGAATCSASPAPSFGRATTGACLPFEVGNTYSYPEDFDILSEANVYVCPSSSTRIIVSNGIPDHGITQNNPNAPCVQNWMVTLPMFPTFNTEISETAALGIIGMSMNGVPAFGAQEGGGVNAVESVDDPSVGVPWYGHAARSGDWHYHSGEFGLFEFADDIPSDTLIGYAMDGFPIYGPLDDSSMLDSCNGIGDSAETYRYHVLRMDEVDESLRYCDGDSAAVKWNYILGCFNGDLSMSQVQDSMTTTLPDDCVLESGGGSVPTAVSPTMAPVDSSSPGKCGPFGFGIIYPLTIAVWMAWPSPGFM